MANGSEYVTWAEYNRHVNQSNEGFERLAVVETKHGVIQRDVEEMKSALKELEKTVWKASGAAIVILVVIEVLLKVLR